MSSSPLDDLLQLDLPQDIQAFLIQRLYIPPRNWNHLPWRESQQVWRTMSPLFKANGFIQRHDRALFDKYNTPHLNLPNNPFMPENDKDYVTFSNGRSKKRIMSEPYYNTHVYGIDFFGRAVFIKALPTSDNRELQVLERLRSTTMASDPRNHTVPFLRIIRLKSAWSFIVQPRWEWNWQPTIALGQELRIAREILEGVAFMHEHNIAHGDLYRLNLLSSCVIVSENRTLVTDRLHEARIGIIDFGASTIFPPTCVAPTVIVRPEDAPNGPPLQVRPPERIQEAPYVYDAFKSDIFSIGKTLELEWLPNASKGIDGPAKERCVEIFAAMTAEDASKRPSAQEALEWIEELLKN